MRVIKYHIKKQDIDIQSDLFSGIYTILSHTIGPNLSLDQALGASFCYPVPDEVFIWSFMVKDKMVGFCYFTILSHEDLVIIRLTLSVERNYRHIVKMPYHDFLWEMIFIKLKNLSKKVVFYSNPINPIIYSVIREYTKNFLRYENNVPSQTATINKIYDLFEIERYNRTRKTPFKMEETSLNFETLRHRNKYVNDFLNQNPDFKQGTGLITMVPATIANMIYAMVKMAKKQFNPSKSKYKK